MKFRVLVVDSHWKRDKALSCRARQDKILVLRVNYALQTNDNCKQASNESSFKIIDKANSEYTLKIKEAIHIHWLKPTLNKQQYHIKLTLHI